MHKNMGLVNLWQTVSNLKTGKQKGNKIQNQFKGVRETECYEGTEAPPSRLYISILKDQCDKLSKQLLRISVPPELRSRSLGGFCRSTCIPRYPGDVTQCLLPVTALQ